MSPGRADVFCLREERVSPRKGGSAEDKRHPLCPKTKDIRSSRRQKTSALPLSLICYIHLPSAFPPPCPDQPSAFKIFVVELSCEQHHAKFGMGDPRGLPWGALGAPLGPFWPQGSPGTKKGPKRDFVDPPPGPFLAPKMRPKTAPKTYEKTTLKKGASRDHFGGQNAPKMKHKTV